MMLDCWIINRRYTITAGSGVRIVHGKLALHRSSLSNGDLLFLCLGQRNMLSCRYKLCMFREHRSQDAGVLGVSVLLT